MKTIKLTKTTVEKLPFPEKGRVFYSDLELPGFGLRVGAKTKTYHAERRIDGKTVRTTIGRHPQVLPQIAREQAQKLLGLMTQGINPNRQKSGRKSQGITLGQVYEDFKESRKNLKPKTLYDYDRLMKVAFKSWERKALISITKDMVERKHRKLGENSGGPYANLAMRLMRSLFNFAIGKYENAQGEPILKGNPVSRLSETKGWYRVERRRTILKNDELPIWYQGVLKLTNHTLRDFLIFLFFTGLRKLEAMQLRWDEVDLKNKTMTINDTKNNEPLTLPLSGFIFDLLSRRKKEQLNEYVFQGKGKKGHIIEHRAAIDNVKAQTGIKFSVHDLRRTYITVSSSLVTAYELKQLVNHSTGADVTAGYIVPDPERLRAPMQRVTDKLLQLAGIRKKGKVVQLPNRA